MLAISSFGARVSVILPKVVGAEGDYVGGAAVVLMHTLDQFLDVYRIVILWWLVVR